MPKTSVLAAAEGLPAEKKITFDWHPDQLPDIYAMHADGDCMEPLFHSGQNLLFSRTAAWEPGDTVMLFKRPESVRPGDHQAIVKRLVHSPGRMFWSNPAIHSRGNLRPMVIVEALNPRTMFYIDPWHLLGIHKCLGPVPEGHRTRRVTDEWVCQQPHVRANGEAL